MVFQNIFESFEQYETSKIEDSTIFKSFKKYETLKTHFLKLSTVLKAPKLNFF